MAHVEPSALEEKFAPLENVFVRAAKPTATVSAKLSPLTVTIAAVVEKFVLRGRSAHEACASSIVLQDRLFAARHV